MTERIRPKPEVQKLEYKEALELMDRLGGVVRKAGEDILNFGEQVRDTGISHGHDTSTIDEFARSTVIRYLDADLIDIEGIRRFELKPYNMQLIPESEADETAKRRACLIIDEIDGTTNTKRALASGLGYRPSASVSIALSLTEQLADLQIGAIYELHTKETYTAMRLGDDFLAYRGEIQIRPQQTEETKGDSEKRLLVIGYSNKNRIAKAQIEDALLNADLGRVYEGCRSSSVDVMNVIRNQYDAYIDPKALWGKEFGAMLEVYDIAAAIAIALGSGLVVSDIHGESWGKYKGLGNIPLVIARPDIHQRIIAAIKPLVEQFRITT